jgi:hypothetical protein
MAKKKVSPKTTKGKSAKKKVVGKKTVLTKAIATDDLLDSDDDDESRYGILEKFLILDDDAARLLANSNELSLALDGLTSLSDAAAESLSRQNGELCIYLRKLPASAAKILRDAGHGG